MRRLKDVDVTSLLTLTCDIKRWRSPDAAFSYMSAAVSLLVKRIRRRYPHAPFEYFIVWETTAKGWPHAHLLLRAPFIPQAWLSATWQQLTGAPIIDIRPIHDPQAVVSYVAKYLAKDPQVPHGMRRYRFSRGFLSSLVALPPHHDGSPTVWRLVPTSALELATQYSHSGYVARAHPDGSYTLYTPGAPNAPALDSLTFWPRRADTTT